MSELDKAIEVLKNTNAGVIYFAQEKESEEIAQSLDRVVSTIEQLRENQNKLLNKLAKVLNVTTHVLDLNNQKKFEEIILNNIDKSIDELRKLLREYWEEIE